MAGEIGHVVYAARVLTHLDDLVRQPTYWVGTLFPDIRHLGVVSRRRTHPDNISLSSLVGVNDFATGMRVHAWIDSTRNTYLDSKHIKETLPWHPFVPHALKLLEDEMLYDKYDDWNLIHRVLNKVYTEERQFIHEEDVIKQWHTTLQDYLKQSPTDESRAALAKGIGLSSNSANEINNVVTMLRDSREAEELVQGFIVELEEVLK